MNTTTKVGLGIAALPVAYMAIVSLKTLGRCNEMASGKCVGERETLADVAKTFGEGLADMIFPPLDAWLLLVAVRFSGPFYLGLGLAFYGMSKDAK